MSGKASSEAHEPTNGHVVVDNALSDSHEHGFSATQKENPTTPLSPGTDALVTTRDRIANGIALTLLAVIAISSVISMAAGAACLVSLNGKPFHHFPFFFSLGVVPTVVGVLGIVLVLVTALIVHRVMGGLQYYGMCCLGASSRKRAAVRVCVMGVLPFIVFIIILAMCILGFTIYSLSQQMPNLKQDYIKVDGLQGPVELVRDDNGLTHIRASSRRDAYFGQGFAEAQDRLFQLEFHRTVAKGELASHMGRAALDTDIAIRTLNLRAAAEALCDNMDLSLKPYLDAFADGVNLYLERVSKRPVEFFFMSRRVLYFHDPTPFTYRDICLTARLFQWQMSSNVAIEGDRFKVWAHSNRTYAEVEALYPNFASDTDTILTQEQMIELMSNNHDFKTDAESAIKQNAEKEQMSAMVEGKVYDSLFAMLRNVIPGLGVPTNSAAQPRQGVLSALRDVITKRFTHSMGRHAAFAYKYLHASNAWASTNASGHAIAASDPHLTTNLPSVWYYTHLSFPDDDGTPFEASGVALIGLPGVHIGRTTHVAWGITMSMTDLEDLFVMPVTKNVLEHDGYSYNGTLRRFRARRERIQVKGEADHVVNVKDTLLGPVVTDLFSFPKELVAVLFAVPLRRDDQTSLNALLGMTDPKVNSAEKMMQNMLQLQAPGFSIPIADEKGNLAYAVTGRHPLRNLNHTGRYPTCLCDAMTVSVQVCMFIKQQRGQSPNPPASCTIEPADWQYVTMEKVIEVAKDVIDAGNWSTYVSGEADGVDRYIAATSNPHVHIPFANKAAFVVAANHKIFPNGYTYNLGSEFAWPYRGKRITTLLTQNTDKVGTIELHRSIQLDHRSNIWMDDFQPIVTSPQFKAGLEGHTAAQKWWTRLKQWDGSATVGSVETAFFWRWLQRMAVLPRDATAALSKEHWPADKRYMVTMLTASSTARMQTDCLNELHTKVSADKACMQFAIESFIAQAGVNDDFAQQWGKDLNHLRGIHELFEDTLLAPVFEREIAKPGDLSSVCVSDSSIDGDMLSTQASSMRLLFDLAATDKTVDLALPGGQSGNPYSKFYGNMLAKYESEAYVHVPTTDAVFANKDYEYRQSLGA